MSLRLRLSSGDLSLSTKIKQQQKTAKNSQGWQKAGILRPRGGVCHPMVTGLFLWLQDCFYGYRIVSMVTGLFLWLQDCFYGYRIVSMVTGLFLWLQDCFYCSLMVWCIGQLSICTFVVNLIKSPYVGSWY